MMTSSRFEIFNFVMTSHGPMITPSSAHIFADYMPSFLDVRQSWVAKYCRENTCVKWIGFGPKKKKEKNQNKTPKLTTKGKIAHAACPKMHITAQLDRAVQIHCNWKIPNIPTCRVGTLPESISISYFIGYQARSEIMLPVAYTYIHRSFFLTEFPADT